MSIQSATRFLMTGIISLSVLALIYFLDPKRNVQLATLILLKIAGGLCIIAIITFIIVRIKRRNDY